MLIDDEIRKLSDYAHSRAKNEMYFGSRAPHTQDIIVYKDGTPVLKKLTWIPAIATAVREIIDNALDEIAHGYGNRIDITHDSKKKTFSVQDNGRGIPIAKDPKYKQHLATMVMSSARAGRNFGERGEVAGTNGIGASCVTFCSEFLKLEIWREKKSFTQKFREGKARLIIEEPSIKRIKSDKTGTKITFKLSSKVFNDVSLPEEFLYSRIYEIAVCNPLLKVYWNGTRVKIKPTLEKTLFPNEKPIAIEIKEKGFRSRFFLKSGFQKSGECVHTIVNNIPAFNGGVHIDTFRRLFYGGLLDALSRESKRRKLTPNRTDINDGLLIYNVTNMVAPNFDSQSKTRLINEEVGKIIKTHLDNSKIFKSIISKNKDWIDEIYDRCAARTLKKDAKETAKLSRKVLRNKVPDLIDASGKDRSKCILFLGEGKSAIAGMTMVRDPEIHGGLPLRGKVLNVNGERPKTVLDNKSLTDIMSSVGLILGQVADRSTLNYGKIYIAHDMDHDGFNIGALLVNFFYTYWSELFDPKQEPYFYVFNTPFIIASKGKDRKYWYAHNHIDFIPEDYKGWKVLRAKGLGTLTAVDWKYSLANPDLYAIIDDGKMKQSLDLIFNSDRADDRKNWIGL